MAGQFEPMDEAFLVDFFHKQVQAGGIIRDWDEWALFVPRAHEALVRRAKTQPYDYLPINYGTLGGAIHLYSPLYFQLKIAVILWACSEFEYERGRPLITAIVVNAETMQPGKGFWGVSGIPTELGIGTKWNEDSTVPQSMEERRMRFWVAEMRRINKFWNPSP